MEKLLVLPVIREGTPPVTGGPHRKGPVILSMIRENAVDQTVELYIIWDTAKLMSRYHRQIIGGKLRKPFSGVVWIITLRYKS